MGRRIEETAIETSSPLSDALLDTTMCIIGLTVEVQVKDGSIYSGIFHTASVERDYGVVLKKASMTKKGKGNANLSLGAVIDTLVVLSGDLVQVVVKGVLLPADGIVGNVDNDDTDLVMGSVQHSSCHSEQEREPKALKSGKATYERFTAEDTSHIGQNWNGFLPKAENELDMRELVAKPMESMLEVENRKTNSVINMVKMVHGVPCSSSTACLLQQKYLEQTDVEISSKLLHDGATCVSHTSPLVTPSDAPSSNITNSSTSVVDISTTSFLSPLASPTDSVPSKNSVCNTNSKEFKLNPGAKTFSPSFANPRSIPSSVTAVSSIVYVPNSSPMVPIASAQPGIEIGPFVPRTSIPVKFVQYNSLVAGNSGSGIQYGSLNSIPIAGHVGSRPQPVRYSSQFQAGSAYAHPNPQTVVVGRLGQVVYVHPNPHVR